MDMYMKNLKPIIFEAHSELKTVLPSIKKSHLYEAFAAFCGFKSYAAFQVASNVNVEDLELANIQCFERMEVLGFDAMESLQLCQRIQQVWEQFNSISLNDIYTFYAGASFEEALSATRMLNVLTSQINENDSKAILVGLVIAAQILAEYEENPDNRSGKYWYSKKLANHSLNGLQSEVAEQYQQIAPYRKLLTLLLEKLENSHDAVLPRPSSLKSVSEQFGENHKYCWSGYFSDEPYAVIESITYALDFHDKDEPVIPFSVFLDWIKAEMLVSPSRDRLLEIIKAVKDDEEKWFWHFIGLQHDINITQNSYRLINAYTGNEWDEDGPAVPEGDGGIAFPVISDDIKLKLENAAQKLTS